MASTQTPAWLLPEAKAEWDRLYPVLTARRELSAPERAKLEAYCTCYARWRAAEANLQEHGSIAVLRNDKGEVRAMVPTPAVGIADKLLAKMLVYLRALEGEAGVSKPAAPRPAELPTKLALLRPKNRSV